MTEYNKLPPSQSPHMISQIGHISLDQGHLPYKQDRIPSIFSVGDKNITTDVVENGQRYLEWKPTPDDQTLSDIAGWSQFQKSSNDAIGEVVRINIPLSTRTASSVLSGLEAWRDEKDSILQFMGGYAQQVHQRFGGVDLELNLDSVAVTRERERQVFVVPPHHITTDPYEINEWLQNIGTDLSDVLIIDPRREELVESFMFSLKMLSQQT